jgi:hypothetical protein
MATARELFERNGYVRIPDMGKRKDLSAARYKKGWEARLVLRSEAEIEEARRLVGKEGFVPGRPFAKAQQWVLPIYGKRAVEFFTTDIPPHA